ncbi:hypothetical protein CLOM_g17928 [Closterium sp. NIES-68]|nr:hypothetical protein CLOM_g17928 [Closterium sp. NIES-68]
MLHAALRAVAEVGKARAAALSLGLFTEAPQVPQDDANDFQQAMGKQQAPKEKATVDSLLAAVMEAVRCTVACECVYVRAQAIKAMIWMQSEYEASDELKATLMGELDDPAWPAALLNDLLLTLHARFKPLCHTRALQSRHHHAAGPLEARCWTCPPSPPTLPSSPGATAAVGLASISHPRSAIALQRIVQAAIWFLGENANFEYAWESATPPGAALMLLDAERMVAAAGVRNPTLAQAMQRLQRCATSGAWEDRVVAVYAADDGGAAVGRTVPPADLRVRGMALGVSNGEDRGASGTGLGGIIAPMLRVLDEMYRCQDTMMRDIRLHEFSGEEWQEEQLERIFDMHERPHGPRAALLLRAAPQVPPARPHEAMRGWVAQYRVRRGMEAAVGRSEAELRAESGGAAAPHGRRAQGRLALPAAHPARAAARLPCSRGPQGA